MGGAICNFWRFNSKIDMKVIASLLVLNSFGEAEKKVPPKHPLQRLLQLERHSKRWLEMWTTPKVQANWIKKFKQNTRKFEARYKLCGYYEDTNLPHGGPPPEEDGRRRRRALSADHERINYEDPITGIRQITTGYRKWAERYVTGCGKQPNRQVERAKKWYNIWRTKSRCQKAPVRFCAKVFCHFSDTVDAQTALKMMFLDSPERGISTFILIHVNGE